MATSCARSPFRVYTLVPALGFAAFVNLGCATSIAAKHPHLERRSVCLLDPNIENDAMEWIYDENNNPISGFHPEVVDRVAPTARTVFEYEPGADRSSPRYLPAPYNELTCPDRFSMLPSRDAEIEPLPEASLDLLLHERRPEPVPLAVAEKLASCSRQISGLVQPSQYTATINVYVTDDGQAVSAVMAQSTLGDRKAETCIVNALRTTLWPVDATAVKATSVQAGASTASKLFFAQPAPQLPDLPDRPSGVYRIQPQPLVPPASEPRGVGLPRIFVVPLSPFLAAGAVFGIVYFWSSKDAPPSASELNPITRQPYTSEQEYEQVQRLSPQEIQQRRAAHIKATQPQPPPTPAPPPSPKEQREQEKKDRRCANLAIEIKKIIEAKRDPTPPGGRPQGRKGIDERWREIAANEGKWGFRPDGSPGKQLQGHLDAYDAAQKEIIKALNNWKATECDDKAHALPRNARQYAAQKPEIGPGKPLEPAPTPEYRPAVIPPVVAPQPKKATK